MNPPRDPVTAAVAGTPGRVRVVDSGPIIRGVPPHLVKEFSRRQCGRHGSTVTGSSPGVLTACCAESSAAVEGELDFLRALEEIANRRVELYQLDAAPGSDARILVRFEGEARRVIVVPGSDWSVIVSDSQSPGDSRLQIARRSLQEATALTRVLLDRW